MERHRSHFDFNKFYKAVFAKRITDLPRPLTPVTAAARRRVDATRPNVAHAGVAHAACLLSEKTRAQPEMQYSVDGAGERAT